MSEKPDLSVEVRLSKGQMVDKYQIVNLIGFGGMGAVYLAIDTDSEYDNAYVALKILYPKLARKSGDFPRRFVREARIASRIQHPNLVKVFECNFSDENGFYYLAQEFVGGGSLRQLVSNDTILSEAEALRIAIGVAQALEAVHKHKVVHRDIKPDNIMFATDGTVKLTDWRIAKRKTFSNAAALDQLELTVNKVFLGTPLYASPEQLQDSRNVDIRSDIYSLGATIYYSLVGKPPFKGTTEIDSLSAVLSKPAPDVRNARPDISDKLAVLLLRMLAKSPAGRPANPTVLLELLLDAGQKYHLRERLGIPASPSSGGVKEAVQGKPVFEVRQASYQPTEATRHSEPPPVSEVTQPPTADSSPEPAAFSEYCPEADAAGNSQKEIIVATAETLPAEKPVAQADRSFETRTARTCKSPVSKTVSREGGEALPSAHVPSRLVAWMIWLILLLVVAFFAAEQWKLPKKRFELCMELGGEALQIHSWQLAIFYYDGASRVPGYENDRRPYLEIIKAKRGMDFAKTARNQRFQELLTMGRQSGTVKDWQKAVELFEAAVSIPGISEKDLTAAKKDLQFAKVNLQQSQRNHIEQLFAQVRTKLKAKEYPEAGKFLETIRKTPFASEEDFRRADELGKEITNSKRLQELLEAGREALKKKDYLEAEKYFLEALDIPGEHEDTDKVWGWLREVRTARFDELIEKARDQATPVDQAKKYLNEAEQIPGVSPERRQEVGKIRAEILENEVGRRKAELQRDYDSSLAKAKELLAQAKSLADYEEVEKLYEQAKRIAVPDRSKVEAGLLKCYRQRNDFLFKAGDAFAARKNWPEARRCYEHVLSGRGVLPEEMEKAKKKILECRKQELLLLLADGEKALRQEDWRGAKDAFKQAIVKAEGDF
ncbi:MAG: protein kinase, partial [Lentisphaerae bacterium]|nr:protein kinase [Lentisphaerota bacterium]